MGFRPLVEDAVRRVLDGSTSLDEISRVVDLTDRLT
jgi:type IV pilus assembly protein PilB